MAIPASRASDAAHAAYSKRASAKDMVEVMAALGYERFMLAGHDRGGRVGHRLALDHPERLERLAVLDIVPTRTIFRATNQRIANDYYHWFFLSQPYDLPEHMIGSDPIYYLRKKFGAWSGAQEPFAPEALAEYERCFTPETIHASCEDYRAAASIDLEHDEADLDAQDRLSAAGAVGPARRDGAQFRRAGDLARARRRPGHRPGARLRPLPARGAPRGDRRGSSLWRSLPSRAEPDEKILLPVGTKRAARCLREQRVCRGARRASVRGRPSLTFRLADPARRSR